MRNENKQFQYKRYHIPNLVKAISVFEKLSGANDGLTQLSLMKSCKLTQSSVFRILATLLDYGLVQKNYEDNRYSLSKKFLHLAYKSAKNENLLKSVVSQMCEICDVVKETTMLGVLLDESFIMIHQEVGKNHFNYTASVGLECPMHTAAGSKAVLAHLSEDELNRYLEKMQFTKYNSNTITSKKEFLKELELVRKLGYATDCQEYVCGMNCVGVPVFDENGKISSAIGVTGPSDRLKEKDFEKIANIMKQILGQ